MVTARRRVIKAPKLAIRAGTPHQREVRYDFPVASYSLPSLLVRRRSSSQPLVSWPAVLPVRDGVDRCGSDGRRH